MISFFKSSDQIPIFSKSLIRYLLTIIISPPTTLLLNNAECAGSVISNEPVILAEDATGICAVNNELQTP